MSVAATHWAMDPDAHRDLPPGPRHVLQVLCWRADENDLAWPSASSLAKATGRGHRSVVRHLEELEEAGLISRQGRRRRAILWRIERPAKYATVAQDAEPSSNPQLRHHGIGSYATTAHNRQEKTSNGNGSKGSAAPIIEELIPRSQGSASGALPRAEGAR